MSRKRKTPCPRQLTAEEVEVLTWSYRKDHGFYEYVEEGEPEEVAAGDIFDLLEETLAKRQKLLDSEEESDEDTAKPRYRPTNGAEDQEGESVVEPGPEGPHVRSKVFLSPAALQRRIRAQAERACLTLTSFEIPAENFTIHTKLAREDPNGTPAALYGLIFTSSTGLRAIAKPRRRSSVSQMDLSPVEHNVLQIYDQEATLVASLYNVHDVYTQLTTQVIAALAHGCFLDIFSLRVQPTLGRDAGSPSYRISINLAEAAIAESTATDVVGSPKEVASLRTVLGWVFPDTKLVSLDVNPQCDESHSFSPALLYEAIRPAVRSFSSSSDSQHPALVSQLRPYQQRAVSWMTRRENVTQDTINNPDEVEPFWTSYNLTQSPSTSSSANPNTSSQFNFNQFSGSFAHRISYDCPDVRGGILSDEMGLGKTLEVISLILMHPRPADQLSPITAHHSDKVDTGEVKCYCGDSTSADADDSDFVLCEACRTWQHIACVAFDENSERDQVYLCPECSALADCIDIKATLIVCPETILSQWDEEIQKHTIGGSLKVLVYPGVRTSLLNHSLTNRVVRATQLAQYDVVLTTYNVLREELTHLNAVWSNERVSRMKKKYRALPSPLVGCRWWRLCIDESQKIGEGTAGAAQMASTIQAVNRWAVSGTPIQRGLEDLYGLLLFLRLAPYSDRAWWFQALQPFYYSGVEPAVQRLHSLLRRVMWRNSKNDVEAELNLPPRTEEMRRLKFTEIEEYLYGKRRDECSLKISSVMEKSGGDFDRISQSDSKKLFNAILRLRQVCCHPQLGSRTGFQSLQKCTLSMSQLLDQLIIKARVECEESQRLVIMNSNGLAAIHIIEEEFEKAATIYREVLGPKEIEVDILQRIHALHNLLELEERREKEAHNKASVLFQAELARVREQEGTLKNQFLNRHSSRVLEAAALLTGLKREIEEDKDMLPHLSSADDSWWHDAIERLIFAKNTDFLHRARDALSQEAHANGLPTIADRFRDLRGMDFTIMTEFDRLLRSRTDALKALKKLGSSSMDPRDLAPELAKTMECSRCHASKDGKNKKNPVCSYCKVEEKILEYEKLVFTFKIQRVNQMNQEEESLNKIDSELERLLKLLGSYVSNGNLSARFLAGSDDGHHAALDVRKRLAEEFERHMRLYGLLKREIKIARQQWQAQYDFLMAIDELQMCTFRVRLRYDGEEVPEEEAHAKIHSFEVPLLRTRFQTEKTSYELEFRQHVSQLRYLENLANKAKSAQPVAELSVCPICQENLKEEIVMFQCGHEVCPACMMRMLERVKSHAGTIRCPNCRSRMNADEATYIKRTVDAATTSSSKPAGETAVGQDESNTTATVELKGSWGTKLEAVVKHLMSIFSADPLAKALVFSQWPDILTLLSKALKMNGTSFLQMQGDKKQIKKCLDKFKHDPTMRVLGLSLGKGAEGLNLTEASHVVFVEPTVNPSAEQQAIGRVHRIGQTKPSTVTRFIIERTIEMNVHRLGQRRAADSESELGSVSGFGARQKESDILNMDDLNALLAESADGESLSANKLDATKSDALTEAESARLREAALNAQYWNTLVLVNNRLVPRNIALGTVQRQVYYELMSKGVDNAALENMIDFKGKRLCQEVIDEIKRLPEPETNPVDVLDI